MIRYVKHAYLDREKYDLCVKLDHSALLYAHSWYLDTVCENWDALVLNDYAAVWPLPVRMKFGFTYFFRPFGVQQLGVFSKTPLSNAQLGMFIDAVCENCSFAELYLNEGQMPKSTHKDIIIAENQNYILDISRSYEEIYSGYSKNLRRNIKKATKHSWSIFEHDSPDVLLELFKTGRGGALKLSPEFYRVMSKLMYTCLHQNKGHLWTVYGARNELCAGIFVTEFNNRLTLLATAVSETGRELLAMPYLLNEYIIHQSLKHNILDFEGSNDDNLARFYAGFGGSREVYPGLKYNGLPLILKWLK